MNKGYYYPDRLNTPQWQKRRLEIITRDNCTCRYCSDQSTKLDIHHKYYITGKEPYEYPDEALVSACKPCHECITILQELGHDAIVSVKLGNPSLPEMIIILMVHKDFVGKIGVSMFVNATSSRRMELKSTLTDKHIRKMNELLDMAENLI
ncbi:MAG: HNH endonuclease [Agriterribacter sp.]